VVTTEERVAFLEGRVVEQSNTLDAVRTDIALLGERMDRRFEAVDLRFLGIDRRFLGIDQRFDRIDERFDALEQRVDRKIDALDAKLSRHFMWLAGILVTTLAALTAAVLAR
jgi:uncharacterized coiled-coil protein SlyX